MTEEKIFLNGLREKTPITEAVRTSLEDASKNNLHRLRNKKAQRFSDLWLSQKNTATINQKDEAGIAFISKVLGLGDDVARRFATGDRSAFNFVGVRKAQIPGTDLSGFWQKVRIIFPDIYSDKDVDFLIRGGVDAVIHFLEQLETPGTEKSPVLNLLAVNTRSYSNSAIKVKAAY